MPLGFSFFQDNRINNKGIVNPYGSPDSIDGIGNSLILQRSDCLFEMIEF